MTFLLDVNVLFVLHQPRHLHFKRVFRWFKQERVGAFATCPITQSGLVRLLTQPTGLDVFRAGEARDALRNFVQLPGHVFWPDLPPYLDASQRFSRRTQGYRQITDSYLLGLALHNKGRLATLDEGIAHLASAEFSSLVELIV
jgi:hypothetical protein